jgi:hypothetical protein
MDKIKLAQLKAVYEDYTEHGLSFIDAVERLQRLNYAPKEAEELVTKWADGLAPG